MTYHRFTRKEFYDLVWSTPLTHLAKRFGISDVALGKACRSAGIPHPSVGYWAKLEAGKKIVKTELPSRGLGQSDIIEFGDDPYRRYYRDDGEILSQPMPSPPVFPEDLETVRARAKTLAAKAPLRASMTNPHPLIAALLEQDEKRKEEIARNPRGFVWDKPLFDTPLEKRRLRFLNRLFLALAHCGCKPSIRGKEARELHARVGDCSMPFKLGTPAEVNEQPVRGGSGNRKVSDKMMLRVEWWMAATDIPLTWEDTETSKLEDQLGDIVVGILVAGEWMYRAAQRHHYEYEVERRQEIEANIRRQKEEAEQRERERIEKIQRERRRQLVREMLCWRRANDLRTYIRAVLDKARNSGDTALIAKAERWAEWASSEADDIDPLGRISQGWDFPGIE